MPKLSTRLVALALAASLAAPGTALAGGKRSHHGGHDAAPLIFGAIAGLAIGSIIASSGKHDSHRRHGGHVTYYHPPVKHYTPPPVYHYAPPTVTYYTYTVPKVRHYKPRRGHYHGKPHWRGHKARHYNKGRHYGPNGPNW